MPSSKARLAVIAFLMLPHLAWAGPLGREYARQSSAEAAATEDAKFNDLLGRATNQCLMVIDETSFRTNLRGCTSGR